MRHDYIHHDHRPDHYAVARAASGAGVLVQVGDERANQARGSLDPDQARRLARSIRAAIRHELNQMSTAQWTVERAGRRQIRLGIQDAFERMTTYVTMPEDAAAHCADQIDQARSGIAA